MPLEAHRFEETSRSNELTVDDSNDINWDKQLTFLIERKLNKILAVPQHLIVPSSVNCQPNSNQKKKRKKKVIPHTQYLLAII